MKESMKNAERFLGFADTYENARPTMPPQAAEIIRLYLGRTPDTVVDLGCGTGLSTAAWGGRCRRVIGVEPNGDMLAVAQKKQTDTVSFVQAYSHATGLPDRLADAVVCSQSFHWMEPRETLTEVDRILKPGGVFATVDCDWPPVCGWAAEKAYAALFEKVHAIERQSPEIGGRFHRWDKETHLTHIRQAGCFRFAREIVFSHAETGGADRMVALALSQGGLQSILKTRPEWITGELDAYRRAMAEIFGSRQSELLFCYRMRIGVK